MDGNRAVKAGARKLFYEVFKLRPPCRELPACDDVICNLLPLIFGRVPHDWDEKHKAIAENCPDFKCYGRRTGVGWIYAQFVRDRYHLSRLASP
uniref:Uncharacterized protein n=1 Tax=Rhodococcus hoagii TaxID=43767 RepID=A0A1Z1UVR6_RHOHA|nr:hypothetical protein pVAPB1475_0501 [Prescottella equi]